MREGAAGLAAVPPDGHETPPRQWRLGGGVADPAADAGGGAYSTVIWATMPSSKCGVPSAVSTSQTRK